ncbi:MAG: ABC transporter ATP-binding protein [Cellulosilyticaceae bacterium]
MQPLLKGNALIKTFAHGEQVLKGISLGIMPHSFTVLLGPSGSGKTTLLNVLSGLTKPTSGEVSFGDTCITTLTSDQLADWKRDHTGNIFQNYLLLNNLTVRENIQIGLSPHTTPIPFDELTKLLDIDTLLDKFPSELSGGQQQRVAIARAVIKKPALLFCDEATGALDEANSKKVVALLQSLQQNFGITILFVTHNLQISETADRVLTIKDGLIHEDRTNANPLSAYDMVWG